MRPTLPLVALALALCACDDRSTLTGPQPEICGPYPPPASSPYALPIPVGDSSLVQQGNCGPFTHSGSIRYAYDFSLAIGRPITAARSGTVLEVEESFRDSVDHGLNEANLLRIEHGDGTVARYLHLQQGGVLVEVGDAVLRGQEVARAGFTGFTGPSPHLHFEVFACESGCETIAVTFVNAEPPAPDGLLEGVTYRALPIP